MVESPPGTLAQEMLALGNHAFRMTPASDHRRRPGVGLEMRDKGGDITQRDAEIGVHEENDFPAGGEHPGADGKAFAAVHRIFPHLHHRIALRGQPGHLGSPVAGRFDHHDHLTQPGKFRGQLPQSRHAAPDTPLLGVGRNHN